MTPASRWERLGLIGLLALAGLAYLWNLTANGWANSFYSAAAQAGSVDWAAFFYGSSDAANSITVDKAPASLWVMALSVRLLGLSPFAILLPEALMGVASVAVLYATVRRRFPAPTALLAGLVLAVTPVATLMFRFNNPDALLTLLLGLATYLTLRALERGRLGWLLWAGAMVGFAFLTKQLQAFLILPVLAGVYLWAAPLALRTRIWQLLAALGVVVVSAGWWVAIVELVPPSTRPYIGGSQTNSFLELTFGYNGFGRLTGSETGSVTGGLQNWGATGLGRLLNTDNGGQISWLGFAAIASVVISLLLMRRLPRDSVSRATVLLLGGTLAVTALAFSLMAGIFHPYYSVGLAPAIAGSFAIGVGMLWSRRERQWSRIAMALLVVVTVGWSYTLLQRSENWQPWLRVVILVLGMAAAVLLVLPRSGMRVAAAAASAALVAVLAGPLAFTLVTVLSAHSGAIPAAGPGGAIGNAQGTFLRRAAPPAIASPPANGVANPGPGALLANGGGGLLNASKVSPELAAALSEGAASFTWLGAAIGSNEAAGYQLATGFPVMAIGGFNGSDPSPTLAQFQSYVGQGRIHWYIVGTLGRANGGSDSAAGIAGWVAGRFAATTIAGIRFFDLTKPLAGQAPGPTSPGLPPPAP